MFHAITRADGVNVAICTHNDADHANGILGFLEVGFRCDEVWLPGCWLSALPDVLKPLVEVFVELANNVAQSSIVTNTEERLTEFTPLEAYYEQVRDSESELTESDAWISVPDD